MSKILDGVISHDKFTRLLSKGKFDSISLWKQGKVMTQKMFGLKALILRCRRQGKSSKNGEDTAYLYLISTNLSLFFEQVTTLYKKTLDCRTIP